MTVRQTLAYGPFFLFLTVPTRPGCPGARCAGGGPRERDAGKALRAARLRRPARKRARRAALARRRGDAAQLSGELRPLAYLPSIYTCWTGFASRHMCRAISVLLDRPKRRPMYVSACHASVIYSGHVFKNLASLRRFVMTALHSAHPRGVC